MQLARAVMCNDNYDLNYVRPDCLMPDVQTLGPNYATYNQQTTRIRQALATTAGPNITLAPAATPPPAAAASTQV